jgi:DNA polymerase-3 subunit epsilon
MLLYLDTATTGLNSSNDDKLVEIAILEQTGEILLNTLINPERNIPKIASNIHGITNNVVSDSPTFEQLWPQIKKLIDGKDVVMYNAKYDVQFFPNSLSNARSINCAMLEYAERINQGRWVKLASAAQRVNHSTDENIRRALAGARACKAIWEWVQLNQPVTRKRTTRPTLTDTGKVNADQSILKKHRKKFNNAPMNTKQTEKASLPSIFWLVLFGIAVVIISHIF